jgi:methionine aminopeptidase
MAVARRVKSPLEIALVRRASELAGVSIATTMAMCVPGVTERAAAAAGHGAMFAAGADYLAFEPALSSGRRAGLKHCAPTWRAFEPGDLVFIDTGAVVSGYYSDVSRSVAVGELTAEGRRLLAAGEVLTPSSSSSPPRPRSGPASARDPDRRRPRLCGRHTPGGFGHASAACCSSPRACATARPRTYSSRG